MWEFFGIQQAIWIADSAPESINIKEGLSFPFLRKNAFLGQTAGYWMAHAEPSLHLAGLIDNMSNTYNAWLLLHLDG